jgi:secreted PhoX family phosphatase
MRRSMMFTYALASGLALTMLTVRAAADDKKDDDFGLFIAHQLSAQAEELFGFNHPLESSSVGPYDGADNLKAIEVADGLTASLVSSSVASAADQIAMWPNDDNPRYLFVCDEETSTPAVQRVDLTKPAGSNVTTIVNGLSSCDPVRRTPWGTIIVAEEAGSTGGVYELFNPADITTAITVTNRTTGANTDSAHLVKQKAVGSVSFESFAVKPDGTLIYGDELAPSGGTPGGAIYKFVPASPYSGGAPVTSATFSPLSSGNVFGLRVAANGSSNWGQGAEVGMGRWVAIDPTAPNLFDGNGNIILRSAQAVQKFTGFYRPEDMDVDPIAGEDGVFRACWANTGRLNFGGDTTVENSAVHGEVLCLVEQPSVTAPTGTVPVVTKFVIGNQQFGMPDNVAFQPRTGNLVVLEDGPTSVMTANGEQPRGNDLWICLPDGDDDDTLSDGCVRFASVRDTSAEPSGFIFVGNGESAFVNIQHRHVNDLAGAGNHGALVKISGFKIHEKHGHGHDDHGHD